MRDLQHLLPDQGLASGLDLGVGLGLGPGGSDSGLAH